MRQLVILLFLIVVAVVLTTLAQGNSAKVVVFLSTSRIDFSLNFMIVVAILTFGLMHLALRTLRASGQLPQKIRQHWFVKKQKVLLHANTQAFVSLLTGDEQSADQALQNAIKTGIETDLSYLIRATSALQAGQFDFAEKILMQNKAQSGEHFEVLVLLKAKVALAQEDFSKALDLINQLPSTSNRLQEVKQTHLLALAGLKNWQSALEQHRLVTKSCKQRNVLFDQALEKIYTGLCELAKNDGQEMLRLLANATPSELQNKRVLTVLALTLIESEMVTEARKMLENALAQDHDGDLLLIYRKVAMLQSEQCLPFLERLLQNNPLDVRLLVLAAEVCEREQLWGKAISIFEKAYTVQPTAQIAGKLENLHARTNQFDKSSVWHHKLNQHLGGERRLK